jgi:hypothetical protein
VAKIDKLTEQARAPFEPGEEIRAAVQGTYETKIMGSDTLPILAKSPLHEYAWAARRSDTRSCRARGRERLLVARDYHSVGAAGLVCVGRFRLAGPR